MGTLKHEFIEYVLTSEFTVPYKRMIKILISAPRRRRISGKSGW